MKCDTLARIPHMRIRLDIRNHAVHSDCTAIHIDRPANHMADLRTRLHLNGSILNPDRAGRAHGTGRAFHTISHRGILDLTAAFHDQLSLFGHTNSGHTAEIAENGTLAQSDGAGHRGVRGDNSILDDSCVINLICPASA